MFIFCNESSTDRPNGMRRTGWAPKGESPYISALINRGKHFHILPAISLDGIVDMLVFKGHTDRIGLSSG